MLENRLKKIMKKMIVFIFLILLTVVLPYSIYKNYFVEVKAPLCCETNNDVLQKEEVVQEEINTQVDVDVVLSGFDDNESAQSEIYDKEEKVCNEERDICFDSVGRIDPASEAKDRTEPVCVAEVQEKDRPEPLKDIEEIKKIEELEEPEIQYTTEGLGAEIQDVYESMSYKDLKKYSEYTGVLFLRKLYNHSLVEERTKKWVINASFHNILTFEAFDHCGNSRPLSCLLFGDFKIEDIFLLSKLSGDGNLSRWPPGIQIDIPLGENGRGNDREEQFLAYLAPFSVDMCAEKREKRVDVGAIYRFRLLDSEKLGLSLGFNLPIKSVKQIMNLNFRGVNPFDFGFAIEDLSQVRQLEYVVQTFDMSFKDMRDFFTRAILEPKKLTFCERQNRVGVGDLSFFALFDVASFLDRIDGLQFGVDLIFPLADKPKGCTVWEIVLGNGGAYQVGLNANILYKTSKSYFNPSAQIGGRFSSSYKSKRRVPKLKGFSDEEDYRIVHEVPDLFCSRDFIFPEFCKYYVTPFCEFDSCVKEFADQAVCTKTKLGKMVQFSLGNYFYNVFKTDFMLNIFYDFVYQEKDEVCVIDQKGTFNTALLEKCTELRSHQISWNLAYKGKDDIEINVGSKHIVGGVNSPKEHEMFISIVAVF